MKAKILNALKTKYASIGLSNEALDGVASILEKTIEKEEDIANAIAGDEVARLLKVFQKDIDKYRTEAQKAKADLDTYRKDHPEKDGDDDGDEDEGDDDDDQGEGDNGKKGGKAARKKEGSRESAALKAILDEFKGVKAELEAMKRGKVTDGRKEKMTAAIKGLTDTQKKLYNRIKLDDLTDEEFDTLMEDVKTEVEELTADNEAKGASFSAPGGGEHRPASKKDATDAQFDEILGSMSI